MLYAPNYFPFEDSSSGRQLFAVEFSQLDFPGASQAHLRSRTEGR